MSAEVPVILVGHGGLAEGMRDAVELILGTQERVHAVGLPPAGDPDQLEKQVKRVLAELEPRPGGVLVLADLLGGTPANVAGRLALDDPSIQVVAGLSLPMALAVLTGAAATAQRLAEVAVHAGSAGAVDVGERLRDAARAAGR